MTDLSKSIILEIKASELIKNQSFPCGMTLRFPRVVKVRFDKDWWEGMSSRELQEMQG
jgi:DNA ligase-4